LKKKYWAYLALLAGWIVFCYWLYAKEVFPRFHGLQETTGPQHVKDLNLPLAFTWGSDVPLAGKGYSAWLKDLAKVDSIEEIMIVKGYYFRDEQESIQQGEALAKRRADRVLDLDGLSRDHSLVLAMPQEINADVRTNPFEAIGIERIALSDVLRIAGDTIELCFPIKDSLVLPLYLLNRFDAWLGNNSEQPETQVYVVGIADGSGIAEPTDMAMERALVIQQQMIKTGWDEERIHLSTGQRSNPNSIRNRCVIVYKVR